MTVVDVLHASQRTAFVFPTDPDVESFTMHPPLRYPPFHLLTV